jgi:hypothetical protein
MRERRETREKRHTRTHTGEFRECGRGLAMFPILCACKVYPYNTEGLLPWECETCSHPSNKKHFSGIPRLLQKPRGVSCRPAQAFFWGNNPLQVHGYPSGVRETWVEHKPTHVQDALHDSPGLNSGNVGMSLRYNQV